MYLFDQQLNKRYISPPSFTAKPICIAMKIAAKTKLSQSICALALLLMALSAHAELPLTVEGLLTSQNRWRAELGINYANAESQGVSAGQAVSVQVAPGQFVAIPTRIGTSLINTDAVVLSPGLRYGLSAKTELYGRATWFNNRARIQDVNGDNSQSSSRFDSLWLGINHKLIEEGKLPALLGFVEIAAAEKSQLPGLNDTRTVAGKSGLIGATTYRIIDPVVLVITAAYRLNTSRNINGQSYTPGNYLLLSPSMSFAVNNDISLSAGIQWRNQRANALNGHDQSLLRTSTDLDLGLAMQWDDRSTISFSSTANLSGNSGASLGLTWTSKLGKLPPPTHPSKNVSP